MTFEAEVDCNNANLFIRPLGKTLRGRVDPYRNPSMTELVHRFPQGIPGQRLRYDFASGEGVVVEPLHDSPVKDDLARYGKLPAREERFNLDAATAFHWFAPLVEQGKLKLMSGTIPTKKPEGTPRTRIYSEERPSDMQMVLTALDRLAAGFEKLATAIKK